MFLLSKSKIKFSEKKNSEPQNKGEIGLDDLESSFSGSVNAKVCPT